METITVDALKMSLSTPRGQREAEMLALHAGIPERLVREGVDPDRAVCLAKTIRVTVEVADDAN